MFKTLATIKVALLLCLGLVIGTIQPAQAATGQIFLNADSGTAGTSIVVTGSGFKKSSSGMLTVGASSFAIKTTGTGTFSKSITIPPSTPGTLTIAARISSTTASTSFIVLPPSSLAHLRFGVVTENGPLAASELDNVSVLAGESPTMVMFYKDFNQPPPIAELDATRSRGATALVTWEPWSWGGPQVDQPDYSLARITAGDFDSYITGWGQQLAAWGDTVMLRFSHEMNGDWYPWAEGVNTNSAGDYVEAWRHVHDVLAATGASNVQWVWSPNIPYWGSTDLAGLYPGAGYVDVVALDGYNWGTSQSWSTWTSPQELFEPGLTQLRALAPGKPIIIGETSSSELGGSKALWNTALVSYLAAQSDVMGFVYFNLNKEVDWRINSSSSSATAFAEALQDRKP